MDDPIYTYDFIKEIIDARKNDIVGIAVGRGDRLTINKNRSHVIYLCSLLLIMGLPKFVKRAYKTIVFRMRRTLNRIGLSKSPSILTYATSQGIPIYNIKSPNNKSFISLLSKMDIDIIINQSQSILKKQFLSVPTIGVLNRHNALLPRNRGRLTPFWVIYKNETESGVSIHFVDEGIDSGRIIVQEKYQVTQGDTFNSLVEKNYQIAGKLMLKAITLLENGFSEYINNDDSLAHTTQHLA